MFLRRYSFYFFFILLAVMLVGLPSKSQYFKPQNQTLNQDSDLVVGRNVNMVSGTECINGDPYLQRQNEPSGASSTRNCLHLVFGSNDYRMVDMPISEGSLPGIPERAAAGDAWLGLFKSFNGGESWISTLLPGHPKDTSIEGRNSPLYGLGGASDPTVRAGANGLFYYSGIAFDRVFHGRSVIFVARLIDNNVVTVGESDPIKYLDTTIIDEGTSGQFADKPWIAVDAPRNGSGTVPISTPNLAVQYVARHNVYIAYSIFLGSLSGGDQSKIMFARSLDCGTTWQRPIKISESQHINQGTTIAVSPQDGKIYVAWRRFASQGEPSAIMMSQSSDFGNSFTNAVAVATPINAFDQYSAANRFRTYAFPTLAVDDDGIVYVAWSERDWGPGGDARIVVATSTNGINWSYPQAIDNHGGRGHQIMPSLSFAAGRLRIAWYDLRKSEGGFGSDISGAAQTMDVWVAQASPSATPSFTEVKRVSKYLHWVKTDPDGSVHTPVEIIQVEKNHPNFTLFGGGLTPFFGDYIDIASAPPFLFDHQQGRWRFNTELTDPATSFISWTDNRDVRPPSDGDWTTYTPPSNPCSSAYPCSSGGRTGMRNQNVYSSHITQGLMIGSPVNTKPLITYRRTFLVFAKNLTEEHKIVRLTIESPNGMAASFWEAGLPEKWEYPFLGGGDKWVEVDIAPYSSITMTVFVQPYSTDQYAPFKVKVEEINGSGDFVDYILLNPDPVNTQIVPVVEEYHTPDMMMDSPAEVNFTDPTMLSENIVYVPYLDYIQENCNPDIVTPAFRSPAFRSGNVVNPAFRSSAVGDIPDGKVTDLQWRVTNNSNMTSAYSFVPVGEAPALPAGGTYQLLIYRVSTTPSSGALLNDCQLFEDEHHDLVLKVETPAFRSPAFRSPAFRSPAFRSPAFRSNTFSLAPGETAVCTIRIVEPTSSLTTGGTVQRSKTLRTTAASNPFNPEDYAKTIAGAAVSQALNPDGQIPLASSLFVVDQTLPGAWVNDPYVPAQLDAYGGTPVSIDNNGTPENPNDDRGIYIWTAMPLQYPGTGSFSGLSVNADGSISGNPIYDPNVTYPAIVSFMAEVTDISTPPQKAQRMFQITVGLEYHTITATAGGGGSITPSGSVQVAHGTNATFTINPADCYHVADVFVDGVSKGAITTYTFTDVRADHTIQATFAQDLFTITATALTGGMITPSGPVPVVCGNSQVFTIAANEGYLLEDVIVDGSSQGPLLTYTFFNVHSNHSITAKFRALESWVQRYNNADINGDDEAKAIAVHKPSGNVIVSGYSTGRTTGPDAFTISYNGEGLQNWSVRYDGPAHLGDYATAVAVNNAGNAFVAGYGYRGMQVKHADYATLKYDGSGKLLWDAQYDDRRNGNDEIRAIAVDGAGFVYVTGRSEDSLSKNDLKHYDYYTIKYNPNTGKVEWAQRYDNSSVLNAADEATALAVDQAGNVYVTGRSYGGTTGFDFVTIKYNSSGAQQWVKRYNTSNNGDDEASAIALDAGGNIYVTGRSQGSGTSFDYLTIKYDSSGTPVWQARYNNPDVNGIDEAAAIAVDTSFNTYVTGRSQGIGTGYDYVTIKYDLGGTEQWVRRYDNNINGNDEATALALDAAGNVYVTGRSQGSATGLDYLTIRYDGLGNQVWRARYNNPNVNGADEAAAIAVDASSNVYVTGRSQGGTLGLDYATVKYKQ
jgi:hypothetical protein